MEDPALEPHGPPAKEYPEFKKISTMTIFNKLPDELFSRVILFTFGCFIANARLYHERRKIVSSVCKGWREFTKPTEYWTAVYVSLSTSIPTMHAMFDRAKDRSIMVCFDFVDNGYTLRQRWSTHDIGTLIDASFRRLCSSTTCNSLCVNSYTRSCSAQISTHIAKLQMTSLRNLVVNMSAYTPDNIVGLPTGIGSVAHPSTGLTSLQVLYVQGGFPDWHHGRPYQDLRKVSLHNLRGRTALSWDTAVALLEGIKRVTNLTLDHVDCSVFPAAKEMLPALEHLRELHIAPESESSVRLVGSLVTPSIQKLHLTANTDCQIYKILISDLQALDIVTDLALTIDCEKPNTLLSLIARTPRLTIMDLETSGSRVFDKLADAIVLPLPTGFPARVVCPNLTNIMIPATARAVSMFYVLALRHEVFFDNNMVLSLAPCKSQGMRRTEWFETGGRMERRDSQRISY
ncbi:hypothetical protein B0H19DRAFT_1251934 [Mycena capillaripes]|nr:hypothetical protein B0H19DRAFT_1251934 [Mycena capillaripes]